VASLRSQADSSDGGRLTIDRRVGARIYLRVPGVLHAALAIEDLVADYTPTIDPFSGGRLTLHYTVRNVGNVRAMGTQTVDVAGPFGLGRTRRDGVALPEILPGQSFATSMAMDGVHPLIHLDVGVSVAPIVPGAPALPTGVEPGVGETTVWAVPWVHLGLVALLAAVAVHRWRMRRRRPAAASFDGAQHDGAALVDEVDA
jgi:hypothetical protein